MRAAKSGFYVEGTDLEMDFPDQYPLPLETDVIENGTPKSLRYLPFCDTIDLKEQLARGFPLKYTWNERDRDKLTFRYGRLELDSERDKMELALVESAAWLVGNEDKKRYPNQKTIYLAYDEDAILDKEIERETVAHQAIGAVLALEENQVRDLYRLAVGGNYKETNVTMKQMKRHLMNVANANPDFILDGVRKGRDEIVVLANKALEYKVISLDYSGTVAIYGAKEEYEPLIELSEAGGREAKFNRFIDFLASEDGATELSVIKDKVKQLEDHALDETKKGK